MLTNKTAKCPRCEFRGIIRFDKDRLRTIFECGYWGCGFSCLAKDLRKHTEEYKLRHEVIQ